MVNSSMDLLDACDSFPYESPPSVLYDATIMDLYTLLSPTHPQVPIGYITEPVFEALVKVPISLRGEMRINGQSNTITLFTQPTHTERSAAVKAIVDYWREKDTFHVLRGWRYELYPCYGAQNELLWEIERSASMLFGIVTYGVHMTGYVEIGEERMREENTKWGMMIWIPQRSQTKTTYPGMLDNTVAGGMASGEDALGCVIREAEEEASLPASLVHKHIKSIGSLTYIYIRSGRAGGEDGLIQPECQYVFDLPLPLTISPKPNDSEVQEFNLLTIEKCQEFMAEGKFKPNCALLMLDFFVRHGVLTRESEGEAVFGELERRLHRDLVFPGPWRKAGGGESGKEVVDEGKGKEAEGDKESGKAGEGEDVVLGK